MLNACGNVNAYVYHDAKMHPRRACVVFDRSSQICFCIALDMAEVSSDDALVAIHREAHTTQRGAAAILKYVRDHGLPSAISPSSQRRARHKFAAKPTLYGPVVQEMRVDVDNETHIPVYVNHPIALIDRSLKECKQFAQVFLDAWQNIHLPLDLDGVSSYTLTKFLPRIHCPLTQTRGKYSASTGHSQSLLPYCITKKCGTF